MSFEPEHLPQEWEEQLRGAAPSLPPALKGRTLARCAAHASSRHRQSSGRRLLLAFIGVCVIQWIAVSCLDSQRAALMAGGREVPASQYAEASGTDLQFVLQARSQMLAALIVNHNDWPVSGKSG